MPLFIKSPHQRLAKVDDRNWEQVDLLPTIADILEVNVPWRVDGLSAMTQACSRRVMYFYNQPGRRLAVHRPQTRRSPFGVSPSASLTPKMAQPG